MNTSLRWLAALLLVALSGVSGLGAATIEGRWKLVEQSTGAGKANLVSADAPLRLEFRMTGASLAGRIWTAEKSPRPFPWPSFFSERNLLPVDAARVVISPGSDAARAVYRVRTSGNGDLDLEVEEEYRLAEDGRALVGTVRITSLEGGKPSGSYLIHRRFEREP
jgi:hypothetical protein